jgi:tetratricopeptide (TPR) repeat protein
MKKIFLSAAMLTVVFAFGQKKEIAAAVKAIESGDTAAANTQISQAESSIGDKTYLLEPSLLEQYYYAKGLTLLKTGKTAEGATYLGKINELAKSKIYTGKDSSKTRVYYIGKTAADASGIQGLKEESYVPSTTSKLGASLNPAIEAANKAALDYYNNKKYSESGPKFLEVYNLLNAAGQDNKKYLYYAGLTFALADKKKEAIEVYKTLIDSNYTGIETTYTAKNKKSGEVENLERTSWDLYKKMGATADYSEFKTETSKSVEKELYETTAALLIDSERADEALTLIDQGLKKFPTSAKLAELQGNAYYKTGKTDQFVNNLKVQLAKNPNDANNWYNLGVLQSKDPATLEEGIASYKKAVEIKPDLVQGWQNLTYSTMGDDGKAIDDYNAARKAQKTELANKIIEARRARLAATLPYAEKWYQLDSNNVEAVTLLKGLYLSTKDDAKYKEFKTKEETMKAIQK